MTFRFIEEHCDQWPVRLLCETLDVSPAGYYAWRHRPASPQQQRRDTLLVEIRADPRRGQGPLRQPAHPRRAGCPRVRTAASTPWPS